MKKDKGNKKEHSNTRWVIQSFIMTFILSIVFASISKEKWKYLYPVIISILFIPSVFIYYNDSALIHTVWYFVDSFIGMLIGLIISKIINKK